MPISYSNTSGNSNGALSVGAIIGIVVGSIGFLVALCGSLLYYYNRKIVSDELKKLQDGLDAANIKGNIVVVK